MSAYSAESVDAGDNAQRVHAHVTDPGCQQAPSICRLRGVDNCLSDATGDGPQYDVIGGAVDGADQKDLVVRIRRPRQGGGRYHAHRLECPHEQRDQEVASQFLYCAADRTRKAQQLSAWRALLAAPGLVGAVPDANRIPDELPPLSCCSPACSTNARRRERSPRHQWLSPLVVCAAFGQPAFRQHRTSSRSRFTSGRSSGSSSASTTAERIPPVRFLNQ